MAISDLVTLIWPTTDAKLSAATTIDYATAKAGAIRRAKLALYGTATIPGDEDDIPEVARNWIADKACVFLIPAAIDFYMQTRKSDSKEGANFTYYDKVQALRDLRQELETACAAGHGEALDAIDAKTAPETVPATPAVSTSGLMVDPMLRAIARGPH